MPVYVNKNGQQSGPYEDHVLIDQLRNGSLSPNDMAIRHGDAEWRRLGDMFPDAARPEPSSIPFGAGVASAGSESFAPAAAPAAKKGGCLKGGLIGLGLLLLLLGIATAAGSRFIPSVSCDLAKSDAENVDRLKRRLDKAKSDGRYTEIGPISIELESEVAGAEVSKKYCEDDKFRDDMILAAGGIVGALGLLMTIIGLFVGRRK